MYDIKTLKGKQILINESGQVIPTEVACISPNMQYVFLGSECISDRSYGWEKISDICVLDVLGPGYAERKAARPWYSRIFGF